MAITFNEGLPLQVDLLWGIYSPGAAPSDWSIGFTSDTTPWAFTDTLGSVTPAYCSNGNPVIQTFSGWAYSAVLNVADGAVTATLAEILWDHLELGDPTTTLHKWYVFSGDDSVLLWGGEILPPAGIPPTGGNFALLDLVLNIGNCSPGSASVTFHGASLGSVGTQSFTTGEFGQITLLTTVFYDTDGYVTSGIFTVPAGLAGYYLLSGGLVWDPLAAGGLAGMSVQQPTTGVSIGWSSIVPAAASSGPSQQAAGPCHLNVGDTVSLYGYLVCGSAPLNVTVASMQITLLTLDP